MAGLTYLSFHGVFLLPPILLLSAAAMRSSLRRRDAVGLGLLVAIAVAYTAPWDAHLIRRGVWRYGAGAVAYRIGDVPAEEYLFFVLQTVLSGLWFYRCDAAFGRRSADGRSVANLVGAVGWLAVAAVGVGLLGRPSTFYLGATLAWAAPVLAFQWGYGGSHLWTARRAWAAAVAVPTGYLWIADGVALDAGLWHISPTHTTGLSVAGLPVEEAVFFLLTNLLVVQGLLLFRRVVDRWD